MLNEAMLMIALSAGSGSNHLWRRRDTFDFVSVKVIEKTERSYPAWLDSKTLGSGATLIPEPITGTGSAVLIDSQNKQSELKNEVATENLASLVAKIQSIFSLNISEVASVLGVQRPTIYSWVNGDSIPHSSNYKRLQDLYTLAEVVQTNFGTKLGKLQKNKNIDGLTLIELLSYERVNQEQIITHIKSLVKMSDQQKLRIRSFREMAKAANRGVAENPDSEKIIDHLTGKRVVED